MRDQGGEITFVQNTFSWNSPNTPWGMPQRLKIENWKLKNANWAEADLDPDGLSF